MKDASTEADHLASLAVARAARGEFASAVRTYRTALHLAPNRADLWHDAGVTAARAGDHSEAVRFISVAHRLRPDVPAFARALGHANFLAGNLPAAAGAFERALLLDPSAFEHAFNCATALFRMGALSRALSIVEHTRDLFRREEEFVRLHVEILAAMGRDGEADAVLLELASDLPWAALLAAIRLRSSRKVLGAETERRCIESAVDCDVRGDDVRRIQLIIGMLQYFDITRNELGRFYRRFNEAMQSLRPEVIERVAGVRDHDGKLRVGYLSADFRRSVMGDIILEILKRHDHANFEVYAYSLLPHAREDSVTARIQANCNNFVRLDDLQDSEAAFRISQDQLDILVDLMAHTTDARPGILLFRPAPTIITHLGHHGCVGLTQVDFKITDKYADLPDVEVHQVERPLWVGGCVMPFRRVAPAPEATHTRATLGIADDAVTFGAFAASMKLSPRCLALWRRIMLAVPHAYLVLSPFSERERRCLLHRLRSAGISEDRIKTIQPSSSDAANRARYRVLDVILDTIPYTGGDSVVAALDMGVPVVTRVGERHAERMGYSILAHIGLLATVAQSDDAYVDLACRLGTDKRWRDELSGEIAVRLESSRVADLDHYTRMLESAYREAFGATSGT